MTDEVSEPECTINGVIQVINDENKKLFGALLMVIEIRDWGVLASMRVPFKGAAYFRIKYGEFAYIGKSALVPAQEKDQ